MIPTNANLENSFSSYLFGSRVDFVESTSLFRLFGRSTDDALDSAFDLLASIGELASVNVVDVSEEDVEELD